MGGVESARMSSETSSHGYAAFTSQLLAQHPWGGWSRANLPMRFQTKRALSLGLRAESPPDGGFLAKVAGTSWKCRPFADCRVFLHNIGRNKVGQGFAE